jgi:hypothetical protein
MKKILTATLAATLLIAGIGCKPSAEKRAAEAATLTRAMDQEILDAQKKVMAKFKALSNADEIRMEMGNNWDGSPLSDKNFSSMEENLETSLISLQKNANGEALVGELRLNAKKMAKGIQQEIPEGESSLNMLSKQLQNGMLIANNGSTTPMNAATRKLLQGVVTVIQLKLEYMKESQKIAEAYEVKIAKLLN